MFAEQISVFLENRAGRLAELIHLLAARGINIRALSLADTSDFGILRLIVSDQEQAGAILKEHGFTVGRTSVVAVEMPDRPGELDAILQLISGQGINVEYMYAYAPHKLEHAVMIFRFDKLDEARNLLLRNNYRLISGKELIAN